MDPVVAQVSPTLFRPWPRPEKVVLLRVFDGFWETVRILFFLAGGLLRKMLFSQCFLKGFAWSQGRSFFLADHPAAPVKRKRIACYMFD